MCEYIILEDFNMDKYIYNEKNGICSTLCSPTVTS